MSLKLDVKPAPNSLDGAIITRDRGTSAVVSTFLEHQLEAYIDRLKLQPNGLTLLKKFENTRNSDEQLQLQHHIGLEVLSDFQRYGQNALRLFREFGSALLGENLRPPDDLGSSYLHGLHSSSSGKRFILHPGLVTELDQGSYDRWKRVRNRLELPLISSTQQSLERIDPEATQQNHIRPVSEQCPLMRNCDRIGSLCQTMILAKLTENEFGEILKGSPEGNPLNLPLQMIVDNEARIPLSSQKVAQLPNRRRS